MTTTTTTTATGRRRSRRPRATALAAAGLVATALGVASTAPFAAASALAATATAATATAATATAPAGAASPPLGVGATIALPATVSAPAPGGPAPALFAEAPDGAVFVAGGADVYVVRGAAAPILAERAAGPVMALAASSTELFVQTGMTVTEYGRSSKAAVRHWQLGGAGPPTSAGLLSVGDVLWSWTDAATDESGFQFATVDRIRITAAAVHVVDRHAYPADMDADPSGLYYEDTGRLVHVSPLGAVTRSPGTNVPSDAPLALGAGRALLVDAVRQPSGHLFTASYNAATLALVTSHPANAPLVSVAATGAGILGVTIPCAVQTCPGAKVVRLSALTGQPTGAVTVAGAQLVLRGPAPVAVVYHAGHVDLVRLTA